MLMNIVNIKNIQLFCLSSNSLFSQKKTDKKKLSEQTSNCNKKECISGGFLKINYDSNHNVRCEN